MEFEVYCERIRSALAEEARRRHGRIGLAEDEAGLPRGKMSRFYNGNQDVKLDVLMRFICALGIEPPAFFSTALGYAPNADALLADLIDDLSPGDRTWQQIENATLSLDAQPSSAVLERNQFLDVASLVDDFATANRKEQMRRLRTSARYRDPDFARAYLAHLDSLRYEDAEESYRLAASVAIHLVPAIPCPFEERMGLQCQALDVYASANQVKAHYSTAARAVLLGLDLSRRHRLHEATARLLLRGAYLLEDAGYPAQALVHLREALEIHVCSDSRIGVGKTLIVQGRVLCCLSEYDSAIRAIRAGLGFMAGTESESYEYHLLAHQTFALAYEKLGDLRAAEASLMQAKRISQAHGGAYESHLTWQDGTIAFAKGDLARSEDLLQDAKLVVAATENPLQEALVTLDLVATLLAEQKYEAACATAKDMARLLEPFEGNKVAEGAIYELVMAAMEGRITQRLVSRVREDLETERTRGLSTLRGR